MPTENYYQRALNVEIFRAGGYAKKWATLRTVGVPDCIWVLDGQVCFVEMKLLDIGKQATFDRRLYVTPKQLYELNDLERAGANAFILSIITRDRRYPEINLQRASDSPRITSEHERVPLKNVVGYLREHLTRAKE